MIRFIALVVFLAALGARAQNLDVDAAPPEESTAEPVDTAPPPRFEVKGFLESRWPTDNRWSNQPGRDYALARFLEVHSPCVVSCKKLERSSHSCGEKTAGPAPAPRPSGEGRNPSTDWIGPGRYAATAA